MSSSNTELNEYNIIPVLDALRTSPKSERKVKLFEKIAEDAWKALRLEGDPNPILLENMLVEVIKNLYDKPDSTPIDDNTRKKQARKYDISLLMFGLLDGYYHTKFESGQKVCVPSKIRYRQYLDAGVFIDLEYPGQGTYVEIEETDKKRGRKESRPLNLIESTAKECKNEIGAALLDLIRSGNYKNCSRDAVFDVETGQRTDLPKPHYTLQNFAPKGREDDCTRSLGSTLKSTTQSAPESTSESTQDSDLKTSTGQPQEHPPEFASNPISDPAMKSHADTPTDGTPHPPKVGIETSESGTDEDDKLKRSFKPNIWAIIAGVLVVLLVVVLLFKIYKGGKNRDVNIDEIKAAEGGGILNPDDISTESNASITFPSSSNTRIDVSSSTIEEIASVSVEVTYKDGRTEKAIMELDGFYNSVETGQPGVVDKDFPVGGDPHEDGN